MDRSGPRPTLLVMSPAVQRLDADDGAETSAPIKASALSAPPKKKLCGKTMLPKHWRSRYDVHHCRLHRRRRDELQRLGVCEALLVKLCVSVLRHVGARPEPGQSAETTANGRGPGPRSPATANQALRGECRGPRRISHLIHHSQKGKTQPTTTRRYGGCHRHRASWRRPGRLDRSLPRDAATGPASTHPCPERSFLFAREAFLQGTPRRGQSGEDRWISAKLRSLRIEDDDRLAVPGSPSSLVSTENLHLRFDDLAGAT